MNTEIYYFSGTGNCLYVAKIIGKKNNYKVISIPDVVDSDNIFIKANRIIIVFPSYLAALCGVPLIVERFIKKIEKIDSKNIIAICTCGGYEIVNAIPSLGKLKILIKSAGGILSGEYSVRLPMNNLDYDHIPVPIEKNTKIILRDAKDKIDKINERILTNKGTKNKIIKILFNCLMSPVYYLMKSPCIKILAEYAKEKDSELTYRELIPLTDRSIKLNDNCNGCGLCSKICPVGNIEMIKNKPKWNNNCEMCFACDEWCPQGAIQHWSRGVGIKYHHPEIGINEMFIKKTK